MKLNNKQIIELIETLKQAHPEATCSLDFNTPFEMVIAVMLSAQCTDERVNKTTPSIFNKYNKPEDFANIDITLLEKLIHPCGFYKNKAKNIKACSQKLISDFNGEVPTTMEELIALPGIGRKSANVIMLEAFNKPVGIAVDTHAKRVSNRIGLSSKTDPEKIEQDLLKIIPKEYIGDVNHLFVYHGRKICDSRKPKCDVCPINHLCAKNNVKLPK
ncbi:MAG: endonuclease III [Clostridia bacterium]|nr:endonuclease III [Clostridia bacterium]